MQVRVCVCVCVCVRVCDYVCRQAYTIVSIISIHFLKYLLTDFDGFFYAYVGGEMSIF